MHDHRFIYIIIYSWKVESIKDQRAAIHRQDMTAVGRIGGIIGQPSRFAIIGPPDSDSDEENVSHHTLQLNISHCYCFL